MQLGDFGIKWVYRGFVWGFIEGFNVSLVMHMVDACMHYTFQSTQAGQTNLVKMQTQAATSPLLARASPPPVSSLQGVSRPLLEFQ